MNKRNYKSIVLENVGAVRERERERERESYSLPNRKFECSNIYASNIDNKRAGENTALKVMDKKESQRLIS